MLVESDREREENKAREVGMIAQMVVAIVVVVVVVVEVKLKLESVTFWGDPPVGRQ